MQDGLSVVSEARVAGEDLQGRHKRRKNKEERMKSVLEGLCCCLHRSFLSVARFLCLQVYLHRFSSTQLALQTLYMVYDSPEYVAC